MSLPNGEDNSPVCTFCDHHVDPDNWLTFQKGYQVHYSHFECFEKHAKNLSGGYEYDVLRSADEPSKDENISENGDF